MDISFLHVSDLMAFSHQENLKYVQDCAPCTHNSLLQGFRVRTDGKTILRIDIERNAGGNSVLES